MGIDSSALVERALEPISGDNPAGENARYDENYETVKTEIMKLTASAGGTGVDWKAVVEGADTLLSEKTKDLTIAAYFVLALAKTERWEGLRTGLKIFIGISEKFWDDMFPPIKRMKGRVQTYAWLDERLPMAIEAIEPTAAEGDLVRECKELADSLQPLVKDQVKGPVTGFSQLRTEINKWFGKLPEPEPDTPDEPEPADEPPETASSPSPAPAAAQAASPAPAPARSGGAAPSVPTEIASIDEGLGAIRKIVHMVRAIQPLESVSYRLARVLSWDTLTSEPPADAGGVTMIPGPREEMVEPLSLMYKASNWKDLVEDAEGMFLTPGSLYLLDLQRYVATGLSNQGASAASEAVMFETGKFLLRLPGLLAMKFSTGLAFCDAQTAEWAQDAMKMATGGGENDLAEEDDSWLKDAVKKAEEGNLPAALASLQDAISSANGLKSSMKRRLEAAKLCFRFNQPQWAAPLLETLARDAEGVGLKDWEPSFCSEIWSTLAKSYELLRGINELDDAEQSRLKLVKQQLFELNLAMAAALSPKPTGE